LHSSTFGSEGIFFNKYIYVFFAFLQRTLVLWDPKAWLYPTYWLAVVNSCYLVMTFYFNMTITLDRLLVLSLPYGISRLNVSLRKIRKASLTLLILLYLALELALLLLYMQMIPLDAAAGKRLEQGVKD
jgi:hypothetical protein